MTLRETNQGVVLHGNNTPQVDGTSGDPRFTPRTEAAHMASAVATFDMSAGRHVDGLRGTDSKMDVHEAEAEQDVDKFWARRYKGRWVCGGCCPLTACPCGGGWCADQFPRRFVLLDENGGQDGSHVSQSIGRCTSCDSPCALCCAYRAQWGVTCCCSNNEERSVRLQPSSLKFKGWRKLSVTRRLHLCSSL